MFRYITLILSGGEGRGCCCQTITTNCSTLLRVHVLSERTSKTREGFRWIKVRKPQEKSLFVKTFQQQILVKFLGKALKVIATISFRLNGLFLSLRLIEKKQQICRIFTGELPENPKKVPFFQRFLAQNINLYLKKAMFSVTTTSAFTCMIILRFSF